MSLDDKLFKIAEDNKLLYTDVVLHYMQGVHDYFAISGKQYYRRESHISYLAYKNTERYFKEVKNE